MLASRSNLSHEKLTRVKVGILDQKINQITYIYIDKFHIVIYIQLIDDATTG